jgi:hypothetical protein
MANAKMLSSELEGKGVWYQSLQMVSVPIASSIAFVPIAFSVFEPDGVCPYRVSVAVMYLSGVRARVAFLWDYVYDPNAGGLRCGSLY